MSKKLQIAQLGNPVLRKIARRVTGVDAHVQTLMEDLLATLTYVGGVGLAAPQVFESLRIFIVASHPTPRYPDAPNMEATAIINPEIITLSKETEKDWEGCLSMPGIRGLVPRSISLSARYMNRRGAIEEKDFAGFEARIFQHEYDHLEGLTYLDRLDDTRDLVTEKEFERIISENG